jgi:hypothetical protein
LKLDANGDELWSKTYEGQQDDLATHIQQVNDRGFVIAGETRSYGAGGLYAWIIKTDANGVAPAQLYE